MIGIRGNVLGLSAAAAAILAIALPASAAAVPEGDSCRAQDDQVLTRPDIKPAERSLLCLVNVHRVQQGTSPLAREPKLAGAARDHSEDMVARNFYDHVNADGKDATARAVEHGYKGGVGENILWRIAAERRQPESVLPRLGCGPGPRRPAKQRREHAQPVLQGRGHRLCAWDAGGGRRPGRPARRCSGVQDTRASYTGLDMLIPAECPPARKALKKAKEKLAAAKSAGAGVAKAKRKVKKRKAKVRRACKPTRF